MARVEHSTGMWSGLFPGTSWDPAGALSFAGLEREGEGRRHLAGAGLVFTSTARGGEAGGEQAWGDLKIK